MSDQPIKGFGLVFRATYNFLFKHSEVKTLVSNYDKAMDECDKQFEEFNKITSEMVKELEKYSFSEERHQNNWEQHVMPMAFEVWDMVDVAIGLENKRSSQFIANLTHSQEQLDAFGTYLENLSKNFEGSKARWLKYKTFLGSDVGAALLKAEIVQEKLIKQYNSWRILCATIEIFSIPCNLQQEVNNIKEEIRGKYDDAISQTEICLGEASSLIANDQVTTQVFELLRKPIEIFEGISKGEDVFEETLNDIKNMST